MASLLSMARPSKSKVRSRSNGAKASNAGKLTSRQDKQERCVVMVQQTKKEMEENTKRGIHPRDVCKFKVVFRSKLLKHEVYEDAEDAKVWVERAARVVRARYLPGCGPEKPAGFDCARARVILNAYEEAVGAAE